MCDAFLLPWMKRKKCARKTDVAPRVTLIFTVAGQSIRRSWAVTQRSFIKLRTIYLGITAIVTIYLWEGERVVFKLALILGPWGKYCGLQVKFKQLWMKMKNYVTIENQIFAKFYPKFCDSWNFVTILDSTLSIGCINFIILTQGVSKWSSCKSTGKNIWWRKNMSLARKMNARKTTAKWPSYYVFSWWNLSNITITNVTSWSYPFDSCFLAISRLFCSFFKSIYFARQIGSYFTSSKYFAGWLTGRPFGNSQR